MLKSKQNKFYQTLSLGIIFIGIVLKIVLCLRASFFASHHDLWGVFDLAESDGHFGYMQYIYLHNRLPLKNPFEVYQFYHPPLFYIFGALVLKLYQPGTMLEYFTALEGVQFLNTISICGLTVYGWLMLKELNVTREKLVIASTLIAFQPGLVMLSLTVNNDAFVAFFIVASVYYTVRWINSSTLPNIMKISLCIIGAVFSKSSGLLIAPAIGIVFAWKLFTDKEKFKDYLVQYLCFLIVTVPLGLSWLVYNNIRYGMPFDFVLPVYGSTDLSNCTLLERLGFPPFSALSNSVSDNSTTETPNIWAATLRTMLFEIGSLGKLPKPLVLTLALITGAQQVLLTGAIITFFFSKNSILHKFLFGLGSFVLLFSYITFCFSFPLSCTANFRYIAPVPVFTAITYGMLNINTETDARTLKFKTAFSKYFNILLGILTVSSTLIYIAICIYRIIDPVKY